MKTTLLLSVLAVMISVAPAQNMLTDPSFENGNYSGWTGAFGNAFVEPVPNAPALTGTFSAKMFGNFSGPGNVTGCFQQFPCTPGQVFEMDCFSRNNSFDLLSGTGSPNFNFAVMKIAFFDLGASEIGGASVEANILDGLSPADIWIDNAPIQATAPATAVNVQALILFVQPMNDGGAAFFDDAYFGPPIVPLPSAYPGSGDDLVLASGINGGGLSSGPGNDVVSAAAGALLEANVSSASAYNLVPYSLLGQLFTTGTPPLSPLGFPEVHLDIFAPIAFFVDGLATSPLGPINVINPNGGNSTYLLVPPALGGLSLMLQAVVVTPSSMNGVFAISDGLEVQF